MGPFEIISVGKNLRHGKLKLPGGWKIHPVFNISLLERYRWEVKEAPVVEVEADGDEWVMESIIASGPSNDHGKKHIYLVKWRGFTHDDNTWESYDNVVEYDNKLLQDFYDKNPALKEMEDLQKQKQK
jgi:hypothetical protein